MRDARRELDDLVEFAGAALAGGIAAMMRSRPLTTGPTWAAVEVDVLHLGQDDLPVNVLGVCSATRS